MSTFAKILCDSTSWVGKRITTFHLKYPRYIHAELMTHRVFSKNSGSTRAVPISTFIKKVQDDPVLPIWTENMKGMQGPIITDKDLIHDLNTDWLITRNNVITGVENLNARGAHKQNVNRLLEPFLQYEIVLTGTEFDNWFVLRDHKDAQPEIRELAQAMKEAMDNSNPQFLQPGEWHIPFVDDDSTSLWNYASNNECDFDLEDRWSHKMQLDKILEYKLKVSVARCARVSYYNFTGGKSITDDIDLYNKLIVQEPLHASPSEHQAKVPSIRELDSSDMDVVWEYVDGTAKQHVGKYVSNLNGWIQLRKLIESGEFL